MTSASPAADMNAAQNAVGITYASAGVDVEAGDRAVELMKDAIKATHNSSVIGGVGGFAGLYDVSRLLTYKRPLLATSTDGVGTKVAIAQAMDIHDTIGFDLVGMVVDDIVVVGAEPLYMTDYIACGKVVPERIADIVRGIAAACSVAGTALVGGETAEHPGLLGEHEYDVAGAATDGQRRGEQVPVVPDVDRSAQRTSVCEHPARSGQVLGCRHHVLAVLVGEHLADRRLGTRFHPLDRRGNGPQPDQPEDL